MQDEQHPGDDPAQDDTDAASPEQPTVGPSALPTQIGEFPPGSSVQLPATIGRYKILRKLGEGGMGVVYEAEQQHPRRHVAIKVVRGGQFVDESRVKMFQREADTLARLDHANIASIFESGRTEDGQHFFAMELVQGETLDRYLRKRSAASTKEEIHLRLGLLREIADAVHYAHQRGVIHRDLKPSNIIVTKESTLKILDFGLARITEGDMAAATQVTEVGVIKGTLAYMSPEQARGESHEIDLRADVYALGVMLYEMLTGSRPYEVAKTSLVDAVRVICQEPPKPLRQSWSGIRKIDPDVETIVGKALEKEADRRYASAASLSDDIARYLDSQPILARPPSTVYQLRKFAARNRALVGGILATFLVLVAGIVVSTVLGLRESKQRRAAEAQYRKAEARLLYSLGRQELDQRRDRARALAYAVAALEFTDDPAVRRLALEAAWQGPMPFLLDPGDPDWGVLQGVDFSPDGQWLAVSDWSKIRLWAATGGAPTTLIDHETFFVGFSPDSKHLVSGGVYEPMQGDETVRVWSVPDGRPVRTIQFESWAYLFLPIAAEQIITMDTNADPGRPLGAYRGDYIFQSWPLEGGNPTTIGRLGAEGGRGWTDSLLHFALDVDPGASRLVYAQGNQLYLIPFEEMQLGSPQLLASHDQPIRWVAFHPHGDRLAFAAADGETRLLSLAGKKATTTHVFQGEADPALIRFDRRGTRLASISYGRNSVPVWDLEGPPTASPLVVGLDGQTWDVAFHPNGNWIATINQGGPAIWPLSGRYPTVFRNHSGVAKPVLAPDMSWVASGDAGGAVRVWPLTRESGDRDRVLFQGAPVEMKVLTVDPAGQHLLFTTHDDRPRILSLEDGQVRELLDEEWFAQAAAFGPHGRLAAVGGGWQDSMPDHAVIRVWDLESGEVRVLDAGDGLAILDLQFLPDLRLLSSGHGGLRLWNLETETHELIREEGVDDIELSRDGQRLVMTVKGGKVRVHDFETGASRLLDTGKSGVDSVAFDPTGTIVVAGHDDGTVSVGPVTGGNRHLLLGHTGSCSVTVSHDGRWIASGGGRDATVRLWAMPDLTHPPLHVVPHQEFLDRLGRLTNLRVVADENSSTGYRLHRDPFPGWETMHTW